MASHARARNQAAPFSERTLIRTRRADLVGMFPGPDLALTFADVALYFT